MGYLVADKFQKLRSMMNEKLKRRWAACEALALGRGGIAAVAQATGMSRTTIRKGIHEVQELYPDLADRVTPERVRQPGGGRHPLTEHDPTLKADLGRLVDPVTRGEPTSALLWTSKSTRTLAKELNRLGHAVSYRTVARLLLDLGFSLQANRKTREGKQHPDRDAQFQYINRQVRRFQRKGQPVVSVDAKKRELVGDFKNGGREWQPKGQPETVRTHDFRDKQLGVAIPYGVYDLTQNDGWVSVGIDHNTAQFAVESIRRWWQHMGSLGYPETSELLITADAGGSNGTRSRLWKLSLQELADELGLKITVCHFPPGTSKWNKIEHRMFCHITQNWRGRPLVSQAVIVNLIGDTTTETGLTINAELDPNSYENGIKVSDEEIATVQLKQHKFHGDWNYSISPN
jgi:Rhodopirellula transposase DDE domain